MFLVGNKQGAPHVATCCHTLPHVSPCLWHDRESMMVSASIFLRGGYAVVENMLEKARAKNVPLRRHDRKLHSNTTKHIDKNCFPSSHIYI